jgi:phage tail protein X
MRQDADVRHRSRNGDTGTFLSHTHIDDAGGRFAAVNAATVVGSAPGIAQQYPAASSAHQVQLPDELPTGYDINEMPPLDPIPEQGIETDEARDIGGAEAPSAPLDVEHAAPPSFSNQLPEGEC